MAAGIFVQNIALGKIKYYAELPAANDALILVFLKLTGLEADGTLRDYDTLGAMLAAANDECDFTGYSRKTIAGVSPTVDDGTNTMNVDGTDPTSYTNSGGAAQVAGACFVCYDPDTTGGTDADIIPLGQILENNVSFDVGSPQSFAFDPLGFLAAQG
jgi:hypothetical protein